MLELDIGEVLGRRFGCTPIYIVRLLQAVEVVDPLSILRLYNSPRCNMLPSKIHIASTISHTSDWTLLILYTSVSNSQ